MSPLEEAIRAIVAMATDRGFIGVLVGAILSLTGTAWPTRRLAKENDLDWQKAKRVEVLEAFVLSYQPIIRRLASTDVPHTDLDELFTHYERILIWCPDFKEAALDIMMPLITVASRDDTVDPPCSRGVEAAQGAVLREDLESSRWISELDPREVLGATERPCAQT
jgi:hypothetical protein